MKPVNRLRCPPPDLLRSDTKFHHFKPSVGVHTCNFNTQGLKQKHQESKVNLGCWGAIQVPFIVHLACAPCGGEHSDYSQIERFGSGRQLWVKPGLGLMAFCSQLLIVTSAFGPALTSEAHCSPKGFRAPTAYRFSLHGSN